MSKFDKLFYSISLKYFITKLRDFSIAILIVSAVVTVTPAAEKKRRGDAAADAIEITVVVDNHSSRKALRTEWGFACIVRGLEKTILFDTGKSGDVLMHNLRQLKINPEEIGIVVLSHSHADHTGGLSAVLSANPKVTVHALSSSSPSIEAVAHRSSTHVVKVDRPMEIMTNVHSTGPLGTKPPEQSLILETGRGMAVLTGCAHPGIINILSSVKKRFHRQEILIALGGFHLLRAVDLKKTIARFGALNVRHIGPAHCTGNRARQLLKKMYPDSVLTIAAGTTVSLPHSPQIPCNKTFCL